VRSLQERRVVVTTLRGRPQPAPRARALLIAGVAILVVIVDQVSKTWALHHVPPAPGGRHLLGPLWLSLTFNSGAAFSLGRGVTPVVEAIVVVLVAWLLVFSRRASRAASLPMAVGLGLLLGGAAGNLGDRLFRHNHGAVIDFIDALRVGDREWWPVFNVADAAIVVGVIVLVLSVVFGGGSLSPSAPANSSSPGEPSSAGAEGPHGKSSGPSIPGD
jgi:signal peptidase II